MSIPDEHYRVILMALRVAIQCTSNDAAREAYEGALEAIQAANANHRGEALERLKDLELWHSIPGSAEQPKAKW